MAICASAARGAASTLAEPTPARPAEPARTRADALAILLVDDDAADAELFVARVDAAVNAGVMPPARVTTARCLAEARAALDLPCDIVVLDLSLPDASGLDALFQLRAPASVPVIVLSGGDETVALQALRAGAQDYVSKPPPDGPSLWRILRYARERHRLLGALNAAMQLSLAATRRAEVLSEAGRRLAASAHASEGLEAVAHLLVPHAVDCVAALLDDVDGGPAVARVWHEDASLAERLRAQTQRVVDARAERTLPDTLHAGDAVEVGDVGDTLQPLFVALGLTTATVLTLRDGARPRGLLVLGATAARRDALVDVTFGRALADRIQLALEQDRLLRRARRAAAARDRAVSIVSHDLRSALGTIRVCGNALLDPEPPPPGGVRQMAELILRSAEWMERICQDLLDRATLDAGRLTLHRRPTPVADVLDSSRALFGPIAEERGIEYLVESAADLPDIDADPDRLLQALTNLIGNAIKFTPRGGRVALTARAGAEEGGARRNGPPSRDVRFTVSDSGPGIAPEDIPHLFDWFWRSPRAAQHGTGLGLAIACGLIEAHRGRLRVESEVGEGATFSFSMPAVVVATAGAAILS